MFRSILLRTIQAILFGIILLVIRSPFAMTLIGFAVGILTYHYSPEFFSLKINKLLDMVVKLSNE